MPKVRLYSLALFLAIATLSSAGAQDNNNPSELDGDGSGGSSDFTPNALCDALMKKNSTGQKLTYEEGNDLANCFRPRRPIYKANPSYGIRVDNLEGLYRLRSADPYIFNHAYYVKCATVGGTCSSPVGVFGLPFACFAGACTTYNLGEGVRGAASEEGDVVGGGADSQVDGNEKSNGYNFKF